MLKTLKRKIALVAVAALGAGSLSVMTATNAQAAVAVDEVNLVTAGSTLIATAVDDGTNPDTAFARAGTQTIVLEEVGAVVNADNYNIAVCEDDANPAAGDVLDANCLTLSSPSSAGGAAAGDRSTATVAIAAAVANTPDAPSGFFNGAGKAILVDTNGTDVTTASTVSFATTSMTGGKTYSVWIDTAPTNNWGTGALRLGVITVESVGAPASVAWPAASITQLSGTSVDRDVTMLVKDATGVNTFLVGDERIVVDISPITGVGTTQVGVSASTGAAAAVTYTASPVSNATTGYNVSINGLGDGGGAATGTTIPGATYTLTAQLIRGTAAIGAPSTLSYRRLSNTASLAGSVSFVSTAATNPAITTISSAVGQAATAFQIKALDSNGGILEGATVALSVSGITGTFSHNNQLTLATGLLTNNTTFTPQSAGTGTITATITTGTTSITASIPVTSSGYGAIEATVAKTAVVNTNGTGFAASGVGTYVASLNVTKIQTTLTGLTPNAAILLAATGAGVANPTSDVGLNPTADSTGKVVVVWTAVTPAATNTITITADADGGGAPVTVATITYENALASISTTPANGTATYAEPSTTIEVVAEVANQFGTAVTGGTVTFTNTVKPAAATAQTAAIVTVGTDGKAKFNAVLGSAVGTYTYTATARDVNGATAGTAADHTSTFSFIVNAAGAPAAITVTGGANTALNEFRVLIDPDGVISTNAGAAPAVSKAVTTNLVADAGTHTVMTVSVGAAGVIVNAKGSEGVLINSAAAAGVLYSSFNGATDLAQATNAQGVATFYVTTTKPGLNTVEFSAGSTKTTAEFRGVHYNQLDVAQAVATARTVSLDKSTATVAGNIVQITATVKDLWGNAVPGVALTGAITGAAGRFSGGARTQAAVNTDANGQVVFEVTSNGTETGTGTLTVTGTEAAASTNFLTGDLTANGPATIFTAATTRTASAALTVNAGSTVGAATETAINNVKTDVKAVSDTVATLSKAVTTIQSSVTELTSSFSAQIKSLSSAIAKISRAIAALSKRIK